MSISPKTKLSSKSPSGAETTVPEVTSLPAEWGYPKLYENEPGAAVFTKPVAVVSVLVVLLFVAFRIWRLTDYGLYGDETFSVWAARSNWSGLISFVMDDVVHPPLFYMLLKVWVGIGGESLLWLKLLPVLFSIGSIPVFILLCQELNLKVAAVSLALLLIAVNGYFIDYAQALRMYSLLLLLVVTSLWLFVKFFNSSPVPNRVHLGLFSVNLLLVYTHYYGWLIVCAEAISLLLWKRERLFSFALSVAGLLLCFSPWAYGVSQAAIVKGGLDPNLNWNPRPDWADLISFYTSLNGSLGDGWKREERSYGVFLFTFPMLFWGWEVSKKMARGKAREQTFWWLVLLSVLPVVLSFLSSHILSNSVWGHRHLIIAAPSYTLLVAISAFKLRPRWVRMVVLSLILGWAGVAGVRDVIIRDEVAWEPLIHRMAQAEADHEGTIRVYAVGINEANTIYFYLDLAKERRFDIRYVEEVGSPEEDHFWLAYTEYRHSTDRWPPALLIEKGYEVGSGFVSEAINHKAVLLPVRRR